MKKLMLAAVTAAALGTFGSIKTDNFESYTVGDKVSTSTLWTFTGEDAEDDNNVAAEHATAPSITGPKAFRGDSNDKYLDLDTGAGELQASIGAGVTSLADVFIDTLVQFKPCLPGDTPEIASDAKLAIWLQVETNDQGVVSGTNLCVQAKAYNATLNGTPTVFKVRRAPSEYTEQEATTFNPSTWYRLTVRAIRNIFSSEAEEDSEPGAGDGLGVIPAFQIFVDGELLKVVDGGTAPIVKSAVQDYLDTRPFACDASGTTITLSQAITENALFPSLQNSGNSGANVVLQSVGFSGTGAVDSFEATTLNPFDNSVDAVEFTITLPAAGISAVQYAIGSDAAQDYTQPVPVAPGSAVTVTFTVAQGYTPSAMIGDTAQTITGGNTVALTIDAATQLDLGATWMYTYFPEEGAYAAGTESDPFVISTAASLDKLRQAGDVGTAEIDGKYFKLGANIDFSAGDNGDFLPWQGGTISNITFNGDNHTISNLVFARSKYNGLFGIAKNCTIEDLTMSDFRISDVAIGENDKYGCAGVVGEASDCTLTHLIATGNTPLPGNHNMGGLFVQVQNSVMNGCTNYANVACAYTKAGGIAAFMHSTKMGTNQFINCCNAGNISVGDGSSSADNGVGGIVGWGQSGGTAPLCKLENCVNTGTITGVEGSKVGSLLGGMKSVPIVATGCSAAADMVPAYLYNYGATTVTGLRYATVSGSTATFVDGDAIAVGGDYKVMLAATPTIELAQENDSISFDTNLVYVADWSGITVGSGLTLSDSESACVVTFTATAQQQTLPTYIDADVPEAITNAYAAWSTTYGVDTGSAYEEAFLLNVDPSTAAASLNLKITSIAENATAGWDITVESDAGALTGTENTTRVCNGYLVVSTAETLNGTWTDRNINIDDVTAGKVTVTVNVSGAKFIKVKLQTKPAQ